MSLACRIKLVLVYRKTNSLRCDVRMLFSKVEVMLWKNIEALHRGDRSAPMLSKFLNFHFSWGRGVLAHCRFCLYIYMTLYSDFARIMIFCMSTKLKRYICANA